MNKTKWLGAKGYAQGQKSQQLTKIESPKSKPNHNNQNRITTIKTGSPKSKPNHRKQNRVTTMKTIEQERTITV